VTDTIRTLPLLTLFFEVWTFLLLFKNCEEDGLCALIELELDTKPERSE
jgi:hypothetical protein